MSVYARKKGRFKKFSRLILLLMGLMVAGRFIWSFAAETDLFNLKPENITVEGNSMVSENSVISELNLEYGKNIFSYRLGALAEKLEKKDRIKAVTVKRNFPDGLYIGIEEVRPAGYTFKDGRRHVITGCGSIFPGPEGPPVKFIKQDSQSIINMACFLGRLEDIDGNFYNTIKAVDLNYRSDIILHTGHSRAVWPPADELQEQDIKRNINIYRTFVSRQGTASDMDFRFIGASEGEISGSLIVRR